MTDEEALALNPGDVVEYRGVRGPERKWVQGDVLQVFGTAPHHPRIYIRPRDRDRLGRPLTPVKRYAREVRLPWRIDTLAANVYADWLDDRGQHEAARMLREAFPLGPPAPIPSTE